MQRFSFSRVYVRAAFCCAMLMPATIGYGTSNPPSIPVARDPMHIKYSVQTTQHALPRRIVDSEIRYFNQEISRYSKTPSASKDLIASFEAQIKRFERRRVAQVENYNAQLMVSGRGLLYEELREGYGTAIAYNGSKCTAYPIIHGNNNIEIIVSKGPKWLEYHNVPYIGIDLLGMPYRLGSKSRLRRVRDGAVEDNEGGSSPRQAVYDRVRLVYDNAGRLSKYEQYHQGKLCARYSYGDYAVVSSSLALPRTVKVDKWNGYNRDKPVSVLDKTSIYRMSSADPLSAKADRFNMNHVPVGTAVQDMRYATDKGNLVYSVRSKSLTVDELSRIEYEKTKSTESGKDPVLALVVKILCYALVLFILGRAMLSLLRPGKGKRDESR